VSLEGFEGPNAKVLAGSNAFVNDFSIDLPKVFSLQQLPEEFFEALLAADLSKSNANKKNLIETDHLMEYVQFSPTCVS